MKRLCILATALILLNGLPAQGEPEGFAGALAEHRYALRLEDGRLGGDGAEFLTAAARQSRYVLLGEVHGLADTSELAEALFRELRPAGFETYVTEVGPWSARRLHQLAKGSANDRAFDEFYARYPFAVPFAFYREEAALLSTVARLSDSETPIWGIDQEFFLAPQMLLDELAEQAAGEARSALEALAAAEREAYREIVASRSPDVPSFMSRPLPESWPQVRAHFAPEKASRRSSQALAIVEALEQSREIYGHFFAGRHYLNNHTRARLMKANLARYLERHGRDTRLLVKLGAVHVMRGLSFLRIADIGNCLAELAAYDGEASLHLLVVATSGTVNGYQPFLDEATLEIPVDVTAPGAAFFHPLFEALPATAGWSVYDLRPLRPNVKKWAADSPNLAATILGYDAVVVVSDARAATLFDTLLPERAAMEEAR